MKNFLLIITIILMSFSSQSDELLKDKSYRARTNLEVSDGKNKDLKVGAQSKFVILDNDNKDNYAIKFMNIYKYGEILPPQKQTNTLTTSFKNSGVIKGDIYYLSKTEVNGVSIESRVQQSFGGLVSGPLIVPFKYRLDDKSIGGDATVGYYAGWGLETNFLGISDTYVTFTPFLSAGLTQVSVLSESEEGVTTTDSKSGFSWATGVLIKNWDSVNIGIVYGQDRIGDQSWDHEGEGWFSFSVGWEM
jgi:opacity protein-like surface antigen